MSIEVPLELLLRGGGGDRANFGSLANFVLVEVAQYRCLLGREDDIALHRKFGVLGELLDIGEVRGLVGDLKGRHYDRPARRVDECDKRTQPGRAGDSAQFAAQPREQSRGVPVGHCRFASRAPAMAESELARRLNSRVPTRDLGGGAAEVGWRVFALLRLLI